MGGLQPRQLYEACLIGAPVATMGPRCFMWLTSVLEVYRICGPKYLNSDTL